jgi:DDE_Tnp_1-associated
MTLNELFESFPDTRRSQGQRYSLSDVLWMIFLGISCGYVGYRALSKFAKANKEYFTEIFSLKHGVPSHVTIRQILTDLDKDIVKEQFIEWCKQQDLSALDWISGDGKSLKSTLNNYSESAQNFCSIVSFYVQKTGLTYLITDFRNKKTGEAEIVRNLLPSLKDKGVIITLDALHAQKKQ